MKGGVQEKGHYNPVPKGGGGEGRGLGVVLGWVLIRKYKFSPLG